MFSRLKKQSNIAVPAKLQAKGAARSPVHPEVGDSIMDSRGGSNALDGPTLSFMSNRFGADFSRVRIHADNEAAGFSREINARAFTVGNDIWFGQGQYQPGTLHGKRLLAHELTHVVQQNGLQQRIQRDDPQPDEAAEAKKKADLITKIKAYGIIAVEDGSSSFTPAELALVDKALAGLPATDKDAIKGARIIRVTSLGGTTAGKYTNTQGFDDTTATNEQKIELSDKAFGNTTAAESIRLITHEVGHAVAAKPYRIATNDVVSAGVKSNKLINEANTASDEFNAANDDYNAAVGELNTAVDTYNEAIKGSDKDAIAEAKKDYLAKKAVVDKLKAARSAKESVYNTKKSASDKQKKVLETKETAAKAKLGNIDDLKKDATAKLTVMEQAFSSAKGTIDKDDAESADYRSSLKAAEDAIKKFYDENVTADVDTNTADTAKASTDAAIKERNDKRDALNKANPKNTITSATAALESAQDSFYKAATVVAFNKSINLSVKKFYDLVVKNNISPKLTPYAAENWPHKPEEFYAEAYSYFVTRPADLEAYSKVLFDWFKAGKYK